MCSLTVVGGLFDGKVIPLKVAQFKIGRGPSCHLRPASADVAMLHASIITYNDGKCCVADAGSPQGTTINQRTLIGGQLQLIDGDEISIGPLVFRFNMSEDSNLSQRRISDTVAMTPAGRLPATGASSPSYTRKDSALEEPPACLTESNIFVVSRKDDALDLETLPDFDLDRKDPLLTDNNPPDLKKSVQKNRD